jgi:hypothetical protein
MRHWLKPFEDFFGTIQSKYGMSRCFILLFFFLLAVILISFVIPLWDFGRFFGTDDYTHLFHAQEMESTTGIYDFFERVGGLVSNPSSGENQYNYPIGLWLFGGALVKISGLPILNGAFFFVVLFLFVIIGSFYVYSDVFLKLKEQKILAVLFLISMPNVAITLLSFRPSIFVLPFFFIMMYIVFKEPFEWKLLPVIWLSIFVIIICHTGSFIFLISFTVLFFLLYSLFWGRISLPTYLVILSTLAIYAVTIKYFPEMANQYEVKSTLFLSPGDFLAAHLNFYLPAELGTIFYENVIINHEMVYIIILGASVYAIGKFFRYVHRNISERFLRSEQEYPLTLPITNISHSVISTPFWLGPVQVIFSCIGIFRLESRGKCMFISILMITLLPDIFFESSESATGILREISFGALIIPIAAALGFWTVISYLSTISYSRKNLLSFIVWVCVLLAIIVPPAIATTYYLPKISSENYIVDGMQWLGINGDPSEKVIGYGYRTVPIYTNMTDAGYGIQSGYETRTFLNYLKGTLFSSGENNVKNLQHYFGVNYILVSDKIAANLGGAEKKRAINDNTALDKIYSSKDFGIYIISSSSETPVQQTEVVKDVSIEQAGSSIQILTEIYKVILHKDYPIIEQFGSPTDNYLGEGFIVDSIQISGLRQQAYTDPFNPPDDLKTQDLAIDRFSLDSVSMSSEIIDNQVIYRSILKDQQKLQNEASLIVRYTFYPETIKREFLITHDWVTSPSASQMTVGFSTRMFVPLNDFILKSNQTSLNRHIYPSEDSVGINENIESLYIYNGNRGIYMKNEPTAPNPTTLVYKGSTLYNMSSLGISYSELLKPGATLHISQFLSLGDEITSGKNIQTRDGIRLINYPDGIYPIILCGYRTASSDIGTEEFIKQGYQVIREEAIPYSEAVIPVQEIEIPVEEPTGPLNNSSITVIPKPVTIDLMALRDKDIKIIGSEKSTGIKYFNNYSVQEDDITNLLGYADSQSVQLIGYMPASMNYNLDTLKIISEKAIPFMFSTLVSPPYYGMIGTEIREPQLAMYHNEKTDVALLPVSYPMSSSLSNRTLNDNPLIYSAWRATIDTASNSDGMVLFIIRSADIGNPEYTEEIKALISYARDRGLTFTTPDIIVDHFKKIQKIQYSGLIHGDKATINVTNRNDEPIQNVTFRILLPALHTGGYSVNDGRIVRTIAGNDYVITYVSTDIPAFATQEITIEPESPRKRMVITIPQQPIEGSILITIKDETGKPLGDAEAIIDSKYYYPDKNGEVKIDLKRGIHYIEIQNPGYDTYSTTFRVKGRIYLLEQFIPSIS